MESKLFPWCFTFFYFLFLKEDSLDHISDVEEVCKLYERGKNKRRKAKATPQEGSWNSPGLPDARTTVTPVAAADAGPRVPGVLGGRCARAVRHVGWPFAHTCICLLCVLSNTSWTGGIIWGIFTSFFDSSWIANSLKHLSQQEHSEEQSKAQLFKCILYIFSIINFKRGQVFACLSLWRKTCPYGLTLVVDKCTFDRIER